MKPPTLVPQAERSPQASARRRGLILIVIGSASLTAEDDALDAADVDGRLLPILLRPDALQAAVRDAGLIEGREAHAPLQAGALGEARDDALPADDDHLAAGGDHAAPQEHLGDGAAAAARVRAAAVVHEAAAGVAQHGAAE